MNNEELAGVEFSLQELEILWNAVRAITARFRGKPEDLMSLRYKLNKLLYESRVESLKKEFAERLG